MFQRFFSWRLALMKTDLNKFVEALCGQLNQEILSISCVEKQTLQRAYQCRKVAFAFWVELTNYVQDHGFEALDAEIYFHKSEAPMILEELCYWHERYIIEKQILAMGKKERKAFLHNKLVHMRMDMDAYRFVFNYILRNDSTLDDQLFIRGNHLELEDIDFAVCFDNAFSCLASWHLSRARALISVKEYIELMLHKPERNTNKSEQSEAATLQWTGTKAQFIELVYALQAAGSINNSRMDIKQLFATLSPLFGLRITNYYSYLNAIALRKKDLTPFLKTLEQHFTRHIEERNG